MPDPVRPGTTAPWTRNLRGPGGQLFGDPAPGPDETAFQVDNTSDEYYNSPYYKQHENDIEPVPVGPPSGPMKLEDVLGADFLAPIAAAKRISFHTVGDTGAASTAAISKEASVTDAMASTIAGAAAAPAFCFHLGDVIYNFGEAEYYYDQFYEPFRAYDRPIFAIPGNHDGAVTYTHGGSQPDVPSLQAFIANFCTAEPDKPPDAGGLARTTMTQPGVYFTLDAPMVSIIGIYTNVLEGPGVITDEGGVYPALTGDKQYGWLVERARAARAAAQIAGPRGDPRLPPPACLRRRPARRHHGARERPRSGVPAGWVLAGRGGVRARAHLSALLAQRRRA